MPDITLLGLRISVYTRIARLALEEKNVTYELKEVDIFADEGPPAEYLVLNPFGTIPCLLYGDFCLYETSAITRYIDDMFPGKPLQPTATAARARMNQIIGVLDSYTYRPMVWDVYVQRAVIAASGAQADESLIAEALPGLRLVLEQIDSWRGEQAFMTGETISLAEDGHHVRYRRGDIEGVSAEDGEHYRAFYKRTRRFASLPIRPALKPRIFPEPLSSMRNG